MNATIIVGLGNPIRRDDAVGLIVARQVHARLGGASADLVELATGGIDLIERLAGYTRAIIIDAAWAPTDPPGQCRRLALDGQPGPLPTRLTHEIGLAEGLELGRRLGLALPRRLAVYAISVADPFTFGQGLTERVQAAVPAIVARILAEQG